MGSFNTGPAGMMFLVIGLALAVSGLWSALGDPRWVRSLPTIMIGISLMLIGSSMMKRDRRERARNRSAGNG